MLPCQTTRESCTAKNRSERLGPRTFNLLNVSFGDRMVFIWIEQETLIGVSCCAFSLRACSTAAGRVDVAVCGGGMPWLGGTNASAAVSVTPPAAAATAVLLTHSDLTTPFASVAVLAPADVDTPDVATTAPAAFAVDDKSAAGTAAEAALCDSTTANVPAESTTPCCVNRLRDRTRPHQAYLERPLRHPSSRASVLEYPCKSQQITPLGRYPQATQLSIEQWGHLLPVSLLRATGSAAFRSVSPSLAFQVAVLSLRPSDTQPREPVRQHVPRQITPLSAREPEMSPEGLFASCDTVHVAHAENHAS